MQCQRHTPSLKSLLGNGLIMLVVNGKDSSTTNTYEDAMSAWDGEGFGMFSLSTLTNL